jgi:predicted DNA-binding transcriptional regulator YafY
VWRERCAQFLSNGHISVRLRVNPSRRLDVLKTAVAVRAAEQDDDGWLRLEAMFQDLWHAEWALWQLGVQAEVLAPQELRAVLHDRAEAIAARYRPSHLVVDR